MSRRKSAVVFPQPAASVLRRSARLISLRNRDGQVTPAIDLVSSSEPPRKSHRKLISEVSSKKLSYSLDSSIHGSSSTKSMNEFSSLRRSLRVSNRGFSNGSNEKSSWCSFTKPASTSSSRVQPTKVSSSCTLRRSPRFSSGGESVDLRSSSNGTKSGNIVLSRCSTKSISFEKGKGGDGVRSRNKSKSLPRPKTKQIFRGCDDEEEVSVCLSERKRMRIAKENEGENAVPKANVRKRIGRDKQEEEEEGLKAKKTLEKGWTEELESALQGAYLTVKPSPNFWKKVSKMVPGKSAQECFDKVNSDLITPRQPQPRSRASKTNLSTVPHFSLSASKLLRPNSLKTKIRQRRNNLSKKAIRQLLEKQNRMDQCIGSDLFSVFEPTTTSNLLSTPTEKKQRLPKILESPMPCSRFAIKDQTTLVSPPVLKQVKNKALHDKYIDHLHLREAKRKAESTRLAGKENIRSIDNQKKDSVRAAKDALFFEVQDAMKKFKSLETENSSSSSEFCYGRGETDEEDESI